MTQAATITQAKGNVSVERQGKTLVLKLGDAVFEGDIINTQDSAVKITFADGATALLSQHSKMVVQEFSFNEGKEPSFVVKLVEGAMRSVSGKLVELNPDAFKVQTPKATVGIRGTTFITKVNADGTEVHIVLDLDQGHIVTITNHNGTIISLSSANQGAFIGLIDGVEGMEERALTTEEIRELLGQKLSEIILDELLGEDLSSQDSSEVVQDLVERLQEEFSAEVTEDALGNVNVVLGAEADEADEDGASADDEGANPADESEDIQDLTHGSGSSGSSGGSQSSSLDGSQSYYAKGEAITEDGVYNFSSVTIEIEGDMQAGVVISGDVRIISAGTVHAGNDTIIGPAMTNGRIVGDADTVSGNAILFAGADSITLAAKSGGQSVYGDIYEALDTSTIHFNSDIIEITNDFSNSIIGGDAFSIGQGVTINAWGDDTITVGGTVSGTAMIYGDYSVTSGTEGGDDVISVGALQDSAQIHGGGGADDITIGTLSGGSVDGGAGADTITVTAQITNTVTVSNSGATQDTLYLGDGIGTSGDLTLNSNAGFKVEGDVGAYFDLDGGKLTGSSGVDAIYANFAGGTLLGGGGDDIFHLNVSSFNAGTDSIDGGAGADTISFSNALSVTVTLTNNDTDVDTIYLLNNAFNGNLTLNSTNTAGFRIQGDATKGFILDGDFTGSIGNDYIWVDSITAGTVSIDGNGGTDVLEITQQVSTNVTIDDVDNVYLTNGIATSGVVTLTSDITIESSAGNPFSLDSGTLALGFAGAFSFSTVNGGTLQGSDGGNTLTVATLSSGAVRGGSGNDSITVTDSTGTGAIYGGAGNDSLYVNTVGANFASIDGGTGSDTLFLGTVNGQMDLSKVTNIESYSISNMSGASAVLDGTALADGISIDTLTQGTVNGLGGNDSITIFGQANGGTLNGGDGNDEVTLGASTILQGTTINAGAGDDSITLEYRMEYGTIDGGSGKDVIIIKEHMLDGSSSSSTINGGSDDDIITIHGMVSNAIINGDAGDDTINLITGMSRGTIDGGEGADSITVEAMLGANQPITVQGGAGADTITVGQEISREVTIGNTGTEIDTLNLDGGIGAGGHVILQGTGGFNIKQNGNNYDFDAGEISLEYVPTTDFILNSIGSATLNTVGGAVTIAQAIDTTNGTATIENTSTTTAQSVYLTTGLTSGTLQLTGTQGFAVTNSGAAGAVGFNMSGGILNGSEGADTITINALTAGTVNGNGGDDSITVADSTGSGIINGGAGDDTFVVNGVGTGFASIDGGTGTNTVLLGTLTSTLDLGSVSGNMMNIQKIGVETMNDANAVIEGSANADSIVVTTLTQGEIRGNAGNDTIEVVNLEGGTVLGGDDNDSVIVTNFSSGTINAGLGLDTITFTEAVTGGSIDGGDDTIILEKGIAANGTLTLMSDSFTFDSDDTGTDFSLDSGTIALGVDTAYTLFLNINGGTLRMFDSSTGNHSLELSGEFKSGVIEANDSNNNLSLFNMTGGIINSGDGLDTISYAGQVADNHALSINNAGGNDVVFLSQGIGSGSGEVTLTGTGGFLLAQVLDPSTGYTGFDMAGGTINGSDGVEEMYVNSMTGGIINSGAGLDTIYYAGQVVDNHVLSINNTGGNDVVLLASGMGAGNGEVTLTGTGGFTLAAVGNVSTGYTGFDMAGGTINGSGGVEEIYVNSMTGGIINSGSGDDAIHYTTQIIGGHALSVNNAGGDDVVLLAQGMGSGIGTVTLTGTGGFTLAAVGNASTGYTGFDMLDGTISGSAGVDNIYLNTMSGGSIITGQGADNITITSAVTGDINLTNTDGAQDKLYLTGGVQIGSLTLKGSGGFYVAADNTGASFAMNKGNVIGSDGADSIYVDFTGGDIGGGAGNDSIHLDVKSFLSSSDTIDGGAGADTINIEAIASNTLTLENSGTEQDTVYLNANNLDNKTLDLTSTSGGFKVQGDATKGFSLGSATVNGSAGADHIWIDSIDTLNVPTVNGNAGNDILEITAQLTKSIFISSIENTYLTNGIGEGGQFSMGSASTVAKNAAGDGFDMSGGTLIANDHNSTFVIGTFSGGTIDGGTGESTITFKNAITGGTITNSSGNTSGTDKLYIENGIQAGATLELEGDDFELFNATNTAFSLDSGTLKLLSARSFSLAGGINGGTLQGDAKVSSLDVDNFKAGVIESNGTPTLDVQVTSTAQHAAIIKLDDSVSGTTETIQLSAPTAGGDVFVDIRGFALGLDELVNDAGETYDASSTFEVFGGEFGVTETLENAVNNGLTVKINGVWVSFVGGTSSSVLFHTSPDANFFANSVSTTQGDVKPAANITYVDDSIEIQNGLNAGYTVSGDVGNIEITGDFTIAGGYDIITTSSASLDAIKGTITGDFLDIPEPVGGGAGNSAVVRGGNDSITVMGSLDGDAAAIYGDAREVGSDDESKIIFYGGNDTIIVGNMTNGAKIYGDTTDPDVGSGDDVISVTYMFSSNQVSSIYGGGGNDDIDVTNMESSNNTVNIFGGSGSDSIDVLQMMTNSTDGKAEIYGEAGSDSITVANMNSNNDMESHIYGGLGADTIDVTVSFTGKKSFIYGDEGNDSISVTLTNTTETKDESPTIDAGEGRDTININLPSSAGGDYYVNVKGELDASDELNIAGQLFTGNTLTAILDKESHTVTVNTDSITVYFT